MSSPSSFPPPHLPPCVPFPISSASPDHLPLEVSPLPPFPGAAARDWACLPHPLSHTQPDCSACPSLHALIHAPRLLRLPSSEGLSYNPKTKMTPPLNSRCSRLSNRRHFWACSQAFRLLGMHRSRVLRGETRKHTDHARTRARAHTQMHTHKRIYTRV
jgi:hypothetical protein